MKNDALIRLLRTFNEISSSLNQICKTYNLQYKEFVFLFGLINCYKNVSITKLSEKTGISETDLSNAKRTLIKKGFMKKNHYVIFMDTQVVNEIADKIYESLHEKCLIKSAATIKNKYELKAFLRILNENFFKGE